MCGVYRAAVISGAAALCMEEFFEDTGMATKEQREIARVCEYCEYAKEIRDEQNVLCAIKGIVARGYHCRRFCYDLLKRTPAAPRAFTVPGEDELRL